MPAIPTVNLMKGEEHPRSVRETWTRNPLSCALMPVLGRVTAFKEQARKFYFEVILLAHPCPACGGRLSMIRAGECGCDCGLLIDPTVQFQRSACCGAKVVKHILHYACAACGRTVASNFLFDERVFDKEYFKEAMRSARERKRLKKEEMRRLRANARSDPLFPSELPAFDSIPGLKMALDEFIGSAEPIRLAEFRGEHPFDIEQYRQAILAYLEDFRVLFSGLPKISDDLRLDRIWRFVTLIYMEQEQEVHLSQCGGDIWVIRHEAYDEG